MGYKIADIEGIGSVYAQKLSRAGITNTHGLLKLCCDRTGRRRVAKQTGLTETQLLKWANMADLMRIKGIGPQYGELLEAAGVDTVKELRQRNAENLSAKMAEIKREKKLTRASPSPEVIQSWIARAQAVQALITH